MLWKFKFFILKFTILILEKTRLKRFFKIKYELLISEKNICFSKYLYRSFRFLFELYQKKDFSKFEGKDPNIIWICWLQGIENAPELVKKCILNIIKINPGYKVVLITQDNISQFVTIDSNIMLKFHAGKITKTHFSDILRFSLLFEHGGTWIDSTYFIMRPLDDFKKNRAFFTLRSDIYPSNTISYGNWSGNFISLPKGSLVAKFFIDFFTCYWAKNDKLIDYFLIDYVFFVLNKHYCTFNKLLCSVERFGDNRHLLSDILFNNLNDIDCMKLYQDPYKIYKLTYKHPSYKFDIKNTYYAKFFK